MIKDFWFIKKIKRENIMSGTPIYRLVYKWILQVLATYCWNTVAEALQLM